MRFVFFGGAESKFAQIILDGLKGAGWQPLAEIRDAKKPLDLEYLKSLKADFFLVAAFAKILKKEVLNISPIIGVHPSLLPRLRGPSPIQSAILNNENEANDTLFLIDEKVDHGPILATDNLRLTTDDNYEKLQKKLAELSVPLILETIPSWLKGKIQPQPQDESKVTYTKKFSTADAEISPIGLIGPIGFINPEQIWLKIRALNPEPGVFTILKLKNGRELRLKLLSADFKDSKLKLKTVQPEGKRIMTYQEFLNGYRKNLPTSF